MLVPLSSKMTQYTSFSLNRYNFPHIAETVWRRTMAGNKYIVAKRLAGEEKADDQARKQYEYPDLPDEQDWIVELLSTLGRQSTSQKIASGLTALYNSETSVDRAEYLLRKLEKNGFVASSDLNPEISDEGDWFLLEKGTNYLGERDRL